MFSYSLNIFFPIGGIYFRCRQNRPETKPVTYGRRSQDIRKLINIPKTNKKKEKEREKIIRNKRK